MSNVPHGSTGYKELNCLFGWIWFEFQSENEFEPDGDSVSPI